jgi:fucose permease
VLQHARWQLVLMVFSGCILACFALTVMGDVAWAVFLLPFSGLFMSVMYPTINSKGISCAPKRDHGAAAGVILFFTCVSAVVAPLLIGAAGDAFGDIIYGYWLASGFAVLLFAASVLNWALNPTRTLLDERDRTEYVAIAPAARTSV